LLLVVAVVAVNKTQFIFSTTMEPKASAQPFAPGKVKEEQDGPLSWDEARSRLRSVLEGYLGESTSSSNTATSTNSSPSSASLPTIPGAAAGDDSQSAGASPEAPGSGNPDGGASEAKDAREDRLPTDVNPKGSDPPGHDNQDDQVQQQRRVISTALSWWIQRDLDMYLGAIVMSIALLILASLSLAVVTRSKPAASPLNPQAGASVYRAQVAAACMLVSGSLISLWLIRRQKHLTSSDSDSAKRREVLRFLRRFDAETMTTEDPQIQPHSNSVSQLLSGKGSSGTSRNRKRSGSEFSSQSRNANGSFDVDLPGTSLTDIYPVYRTATNVGTTSTKTSEALGSQASCWSRIPSLLLADGDWVALQVGDTVPADCELVSEGAASSPRSNVKFRRGQTVTLEALSTTKNESEINVPPFERGDTGPNPPLPNGRVTLPAGSGHLLTLCNGMKIYRVLEPPLRHFIRRPAAASRPSLMARKILEIRKALALLSAAVLCATCIIVLARPGLTSTDLTLILPLPLLAALGVSPVVGPAFVFAMEMLGTARILHRVHPHATIDRPEMPASVASQFKLLIRYVVATLLTRLSLWEAARRWYEFRVWLGLTQRRAAFRHPLVRVPPASLNLLEKLGVATALALVDDELACDPHAMPQQLLIPSAKGLKLLDLCPTYDDDDNTDGTDDSHRSATETSRRRGASLGDSDDDSSEEGTTVHNYSALRRKFLIRRRRVKRKRTRIDQDDSTDSSDESSIDVQFEDPTWWQHLPSLKCIGLAGLLVDDANDGKLWHTSGERNAAHSEHDSDTLSAATSSLVNLVCTDRGNHPYRTLSECIGFSTDPNSFGDRGDLSPFSERIRLRVLARSLFRERLERDSHQRSSEEARWWGHLRPDATSVVVQDKRSGAHQLLTVGDPSVVLSLCNEAWQGEISTIIPLSNDTRRTLIETSNSWKLGDLDVAAFSYSPVSLSLEQKILGDGTLSPQVRHAV
jgi:hypothetical protein